MITMIIKINDKVRKKRYQKVYNEISPLVKHYIMHDNNVSILLERIEKRLEKEVVLDILLNYSRDYKINLEEKFERLGYINEVISKGQEELTLESVKILGLMKSKKAFPLLMKGTQVNDYELKYHCFNALSHLVLEENQVRTYINAVVTSGIIRDRIIEMVNNLSLSSDTYLQLLDEAQTEMEKVIILRVLENKLDAYSNEDLRPLVKFLYDTKEVRIAAVLAITSTKKNIFYDLIKDLYEKEEAWEVRAAIAKSIDRFSHMDSIVLLKRMVYDTNWWVRFNAAEVLGKKGIEGIDALIDISLSDKDDHASNLAYYILNANQFVNKTITGLKEENSG